MASENFKAKDISLRTQKKLLSKLSNKTTLKLLIDDKTATILDNTYRIFKNYTGNKKEAEKLIKCIIKTIIKVGILYRNDQFNGNEMKLAMKLKFSFVKLTMTITSFYELDFSYDYNYLTVLLNDVHANLKLLVQSHLTDKSLNRINHVFSFCSKREFLDEVFQKDSPYREIMDNIVKDINTTLDDY